MNFGDRAKVTMTASLQDTRVSQNYGDLFGVPILRTIVFGGSILESPYLRLFHILGRNAGRAMHPN